MSEIIIIGCLVVVMTVVLGIIIIKGIVPPKKNGGEKDLDEDMPLKEERKSNGSNNDYLLELLRMKEKMEIEEMEKRDKILSDYAARREKRMPIGMEIKQSGMNEDRPVNINSSKIAVPYHLSESEKQILEEFYGDHGLG